jgi:hypothetical protein
MTLLIFVLAPLRLNRLLFDVRAQFMRPSSINQKSVYAPTKIAAVINPNIMTTKAPTVIKRFLQIAWSLLALINIPRIFGWVDVVSKGE